MTNSYILGGGISGLAAGVSSSLPVIEAKDSPGGLCSSYYIEPGSECQLSTPPKDDQAYRFEVGGGHWIFGGDLAIKHFLGSLAPIKSYQRKSSVYFSKTNQLVPYPIQNSLCHLGNEISVKALSEMSIQSIRKPRTMSEWLEQNFGHTLCELFFAPFHELYTAGLWSQIAPQDSFKSPVDYGLALNGAFNKVMPVGYNTMFLYPAEGLNSIINAMSERCDIRYGKKVVSIDVSHKELYFSDGTSIGYSYLLSTLPLSDMVRLTNSGGDQPPDPYTSVLVLNIGAKRGPHCPDDHWLYNTDTKSGFHRVGFYSNVDRSFLPIHSRKNNDRVSIYVEKAFIGGQKPIPENLKSYTDSVIQELQDWGFIEDVEVVDPSWVDVAYTWSWPGSTWKEQSISWLSDNYIYQVGRYGCWNFQGIAESIKEGFVTGSAFR